MSASVPLAAAKTQLSSLVERAAGGEEIVITRHGKPVARIIGLPEQREPRKPVNNIGLRDVADDFDAPLPPEILRAFGVE